MVFIGERTAIEIQHYMLRHFLEAPPGLLPCGVRLTAGRWYPLPVPLSQSFPGCPTRHRGISLDVLSGKNRIEADRENNILIPPE